MTSPEVSCGISSAPCNINEVIRQVNHHAFIHIACHPMVCHAPVDADQAYIACSVVVDATLEFVPMQNPLCLYG